MGSATEAKFAELVEQARDIQAKPVKVKTSHDPRTFKITYEERPDFNRVHTWIWDAARAINAAYPKGHPIRREWDQALIRVPMLYETKHFPGLLAIFERAAGQASSAVGGDTVAHKIPDDELCDLIVQALYEVRDEGGAGGYFNLIALSHGVDNRDQVRRIGERLKDLNLIDNHTLSTGGVTGHLSAKAVSLIERLNEGESLMDHLHRKDAGGVSQGPAPDLRQPGPRSGTARPCSTEVEESAMSDEVGTPTVGIITALPHELAAIRAALGSPQEMPGHAYGKGAGRRYFMAEVPSAKGGKHRVVIAHAGVGTNQAAVRATLLLNQFPVEAIIMCGIAGGVPHPTKPDDHVRLGDIVVSNVKGVVQYDLVKRSIGGSEEERDVIEEVRSSPHRPSALLTEAVDLLESDRHLGEHPWEDVLKTGLASLRWARPDASTDKVADSANPSLFVTHPDDAERRPGQPRVFLGSIASSNTLLKDPVRRDSLRDQFGAKAVEMEASGIVDATWTHGVGYLVVRGICDYCDSKKGDAWQRYAAMAAAAYVRALLESMPVNALANPR